MDLRDILMETEPLSYALDNWEMIGRGSMSYVFSHPDAEGRVIKLCEDPDGWFAYAMAVQDGEPSSHAPVVHDLVFCNGIYGATIERLTELDDDWQERLEPYARLRDPRLLPSSVAAFIEDIQLSSRDLTDMRLDNWMLRGDQVVLNDPVSRLMSEFEKERFRRHNEIPQRKGTTP